MSEKKAQIWNRVARCAISSCVSWDNFDTDHNSLLKESVVRYIVERSGYTVEEADELYTEYVNDALQNNHKQKTYPAWVILMLCLGIASSITSVVIFLLGHTFFLFIVYFAISISIVTTSLQMMKMMRREKSAMNIWDDFFPNSSVEELIDVLKEMEKIMQI